MKKIFAMALVLLMVLPAIVSCGSARKGDPYEFTVVIKTTVELDAANMVVVPEQATGEAETAEEEAYEDERFHNTVTVYKEANADGTPVAITVQEVLDAYSNEQNRAFAYDGARLTKFDEVNNQSPYFWNVQIDGKDAGLSETVAAGTEIVVTFSK